jgi:hypothetical protein
MFSATVAVMSKHLVFQRSVVINRPIEEVAAYLADTERAVEWRADVLEATATPPGPVKPGTLVHEVVRLMGRSVRSETIVDGVTLAGFRYSHARGPLPVSGEYAYAAVPGGTLVTITRRVTLTGRWMTFATYLRHAGDRMLAVSLAALRFRLEPRTAA